MFDSIRQSRWPLRSVWLWLGCLLWMSGDLAGAEGKRILLRQSTIQTERAAQGAGLQAQSAEPVSGLYLIQFAGTFDAAWEAPLKSLGVRLIRPVPEDAFLASFQRVNLAGLRARPFVHWVGPYRPEYKIDASARKLILPDRPSVKVRVLLSPAAGPVQARAVARMFVRVSQRPAARLGGLLEGDLPAAKLDALAASDAVVWIEAAPKMKLVDGIAVEIVAGAYEDGRTEIHELGFDGEGVTVAVADSGLDTGEIDGMHVDLAGRVDAFFHYGTLEDASDEHSHGTHVAGIVAGNGASGELDENGYLYGLGVAPAARIVAQRIFDGIGNYEAPESFAQLTTDAVRAGAVIGSNSWGDDTQGRYDISAMEFDALVRDADPNAPGDQPYILEFSAGNAGPGENTIGSPAVAKNVIATGASQNNRFDFLIYAEGEDSMADFSSRGPCEDGRIKPDVVAPGTWIASLQSSYAGDENAWAPISPLYLYQGGTSQAGPQVSGAAAVFVQYYRETHQGQTPSPALVKAAMIDSAVDMDNGSGTTFVPNHDEGWGRIDLTRLMGDARRLQFFDQTDLLASGALFERRFYVAGGGEPLKITMAYTDVPGFPPAIPALVNDLDLEIVAPDGTVYRGNQFLNGESVPNAAGADAINNVEGIYVTLPEPGEYLVRVRARKVLEDSRRETPAIDQDFALVISGDLPLPGQGILSLDRRAYAVPGTAQVKLIDFDLAGQPSATVSVTSTSQSTPIVLTLLPSGTSGVFTGAVQLATLPVVPDGQVHAVHGDEIHFRYEDAFPVEINLRTARIDNLPPIIRNVSVTNRFGKEVVLWQTDELARSAVHFGTNANLASVATNGIYTLDHSVNLGQLIVGQRYFFYVVAFDEAGNAATNNNNGALFSFMAQPAATVLLVNAYTYTEGTEGRDDQPIPVTEYTDALDQTGVSYQVWEVATEGMPTSEALAPFRVVMWRINDSFWESGNSIASKEQATLKTYLQRGGSLFIASMDLLSRVGAVDFRTNVLQVVEFEPNTDPFEVCADCDEDHGVPAIEASHLEALTSGIEMTLDYSNFPVFELEPLFPNIGPDLSDTFLPSTNAAPILIDAGSGRVAGLRYPKTGRDGVGRVVFLGFPLEAVPKEGPAPNNRASLLKNLLTFLAPGVSGIGSISLDEVTYTVPGQITVEVADSDLIQWSEVPVQFQSESSPNPVLVTLRPTVIPGQFRGTITLIDPAEPGGPGRLPAKDGDLIVALYVDASSSAPLRALAEIDTGVPSISNIDIEIDYEAAIVSWEVDEPTDALVQFGESTFLGKTAYSASPGFAHSLTLSPLIADRVYYYRVVSRDAAGNTVIDDNDGKLYTFRTLKPLLPPWSDDLENTTAWSVQDGEESEGSWELGVPNNSLDTAAHSPVKAWGSNLNGSGNTYVNTFLISPAIELAGGNTAKLTFWHSYDFLSGDATFESGALYLFTNAQTQPITLAAFDDFTAGWEEAEFDLSPYLGRVVQFVWEYALFDLSIDEIRVHPGWLIDDIAVTVTNVVRGTLRVTNNIAQGGFTLEGPTPTRYSGQHYVRSNALAGEYIITFHPVPFYVTPAPQTNMLTGDKPLVFLGQYLFPDANANHISDEWETTTFGEITPDRTLDTDTDNDTVSDYAEWVAGTDPVDPESKLVVHELALLPNRKIELSWPSVAEKTYRILSSPDGRTWQEAMLLRASSELSKFTITPPASGSVLLFKIEVVP